jgi:hypothetical protein
VGHGNTADQTMTDDDETVPKVVEELPSLVCAEEQVRVGSVMSTVRAVDRDIEEHERKMHELRERAGRCSCGRCE